jgi:long-subunit acyl-CoA synthetase (AMP-forming)
MALESAAKEVGTPPGLGAATMAEAFQLTAEALGDAPALRTQGDAQSYSWSGYAERVRSVAAGLAALGVDRGDTVGLMLANRPEFHFADTAAIHLGATPFSLYNTSAPDQAAYVVGDADARVVFTEEQYLDIVLEVRDSVDSLTHVVLVDAPGRDGAITVEELERGALDDFDFEAAWRAVEPDDLLTLIYTSGTTGPPKGVELTHRSMLAAMHSFDELISLPRSGRLISWLPMAHIAERNCTHYLPMTHGLSTTTCPDPRQLVAYLPEVRPTWFFAVPRIWEKLKAALEIGFEAEQDPIRKKAVEVALEVGRRKVEAEQSGDREVPAELALEFSRSDAAILSAIRKRLGLDQLETVNTGAAPCPREVTEFFHSLGVPLAELWGMSETCAVGTCNPVGRVRIGTVGPPSPGVELKLAEDGEILVRGEMVMAGYRNQPEKTAETIDPEGWLRTGDIGELDEEGYLKIVDRKKELIISASGKNMSPANIEATIKVASPLVGQACVVGDSRPYNVALLVLDPDAVAVFAQQHGIEGGDLAAEKAVRDEIAAAVERANARLARIEQIKTFEVLADPWEPGGDELTPTMKLKRRPIEQKYAAQIEALYETEE